MPAVKVNNNSIGFLNCIVVIFPLRQLQLVLCLPACLVLQLGVVYSVLFTPR